MLSLLSYLLKAPLSAPGVPVVNSLTQQRQCIVNIFRACLGLSLENYMLLEHKVPGLMQTCGLLPPLGATTGAAAAADCTGTDSTDTDCSVSVQVQVQTKQGDKDRDVPPLRRLRRRQRGRHQRTSATCSLRPFTSQTTIIIAAVRFSYAAGSEEANAHATGEVALAAAFHKIAGVRAKCGSASGSCSRCCYYCCNGLFQRVRQISPYYGALPASPPQRGSRRVRHIHRQRSGQRHHPD